MPEEVVVARGRRASRRIDEAASQEEIARYELQKALYEKREQRFQDEKRQVRRNSHRRAPLVSRVLEELVNEDGEFNERAVDLLADSPDVFDAMSGMLQLSSLVYTFNELRNIIKAGGILVPAKELSDRPIKTQMPLHLFLSFLACFALAAWNEIRTRDVSLRQVYEERTKFELILIATNLVFPLIGAILIHTSTVQFMVRQQLEDKEFILDNEFHRGSQDGASRDRRHGCLKNKLTADQFHAFFSKNLRFLAYDKEIASGLNILANQLANKLGKAVTVWEFDDNFADKILVYGITINRLSKTVTVVFRGSVSTTDWMTNFTAFLDELALPSWLRNSWLAAGKTGEPVHVHAGYKKYLFGDLKKVIPAIYDPAYPTKCSQIMKTLKEIYEYQEEEVFVHEGFKLCVTGHSLGGALATLLSFELAASDWMTDNNVPMPLTCITFGSPYVGSRDFREAFEHLEIMRRIQLLRVSADCDVVPATPPWLWPFEHVGVNLHLKTVRGNEVWIDRKRKHSFIGNLHKQSAKLHNIVRYFEDVQKLERWYLEKINDMVLETWSFGNLDKLIGFGFKLHRRTGDYFSSSVLLDEDGSFRKATADLQSSDRTVASSSH